MTVSLSLLSLNKATPKKKKKNDRTNFQSFLLAHRSHLEKNRRLCSPKVYTELLRLLKEKLV